MNKKWVILCGVAVISASLVIGVYATDTLKICNKNTTATHQALVLTSGEIRPTKMNLEYKTDLSSDKVIIGTVPNSPDIQKQVKAILQTYSFTESYINVPKPPIGAWKPGKTDQPSKELIDWAEKYNMKIPYWNIPDLKSIEGTILEGKYVNTGWWIELKGEIEVNLKAYEKWFFSK